MDLTALLPFLFILLLIPIFLSGRRQRRQMQEMQRLQGSLSDGDVVVTTSGLRGTVVDASYEETIDLEIAPGVVTTWVRQAVREKVNPPVADAEDTAAKPAPAVEASTDGAKPTGEAAETPATDPTTGRTAS